ncbi:hypothetical protein C0995_006595 [Termitomyces sp. Mi166|nr:hypothetical protein C0995_006595 [Termitomyces sp. Mi166\
MCSKRKYLQSFANVGLTAVHPSPLERVFLTAKALQVDRIANTRNQPTRKSSTGKALDVLAGHEGPVKFQMSENLSLDGTEEFLDNRKVNDAGINTDLIDMHGDESDLEDGMDLSLSGASRGQEARTQYVQFLPTGRAWAAASTEGMLIFSLDAVTFDWFGLSIYLTPQSVLEVLAAREYLKTLVMARLNAYQNDT